MHRLRGYLVEIDGTIVSDPTLQPDQHTLQFSPVLYRMSTQHPPVVALLWDQVGNCERRRLGSAHERKNYAPQTGTIIDMTGVSFHVFKCSKSRLGRLTSGFIPPLSVEK